MVGHIKKAISPVIDLIGLNEFFMEFDSAISNIENGKFSPGKLNKIYEYMLSSFDKVFNTNYSSLDLKEFLFPAEHSRMDNISSGRFNYDIWHALIHEVVRKDAYKVFYDLNTSKSKADMQIEMEEDLQNVIQGGVKKPQHTSGRSKTFFINYIFSPKSVTFNKTLPDLEKLLKDKYVEVNNLPDNLKPLAESIFKYIFNKFKYESKIIQNKMKEIDAEDTDFMNDFEKETEKENLINAFIADLHESAEGFYIKSLLTNKFSQSIPEQTVLKFKFWILAIRKFIKTNF